VLVPTVPVIVNVGVTVSPWDAVIVLFSAVDTHSVKLAPGAAERASLGNAGGEARVPFVAPAPAPVLGQVPALVQRVRVTRPARVLPAIPLIESV